MLLLPFLADLFPSMKFIHVVRDGRDISLGNEFVGNAYVNAFLRDDEALLSPSEKMILFWGRSNEAAAKFGEVQLGGRYLRMRWEDLCHEPAAKTTELLTFAGCSSARADDISHVVQKPRSLGRWKGYPESAKAMVESRGMPWLELFGYR
jgi:hypothetical protein